MSQEELNKVAKLNPREREVLELVCEGNPYKEIGKKLFISESTVKATMHQVYYGLEMMHLSRSARITEIHQIYYPLLKSIKQTSKSPKTGSAYATEPQQVEKPKPVATRQADIPFDQQPATKEPPTQPKESLSRITPPEEPKQEEIPAPLVKSISKMVDEDEYFLVHYKDPPVIIIPPRPPQKPPINRVVGLSIGGIIGCGLCVCIAAALIFLYWNQNKAQFASSPNQPSGQPTQPAAQVINPTEPPQVIVVTATSLPEANPTSAPIVVPTNVSGPVIPLPFSDNFDNGPSQYWKVLSGNWITADGRYTTTTPDTWSIVALDDPTWKNYHVHVNVKIPHIGSAAEGQIAVFVRINTSPYLGFGDSALSKAYWGNQAQGGIYLVPIAGESKFYIQGNSNLDIEVNGNNFTALIDGQQVQKMSMSGYETGGIALGIHCNTSLGCESFDNVTVGPLP